MDGPNLTKSGIVVLQGYVLDLKKNIYIDDWLPFEGSYGSTIWNLVFAQPSPTKELWGPFLEKAWAKVSGNYELTEGLAE